MEELIAKFVGEKVVDSDVNDSIHISFETGNSLTIHNQVRWSKAKENANLKGHILESVRRDGAFVVMDFGCFSLSFNDQEPDTASPEIAEAQLADGRIFVHQGDD